MSFIDFKNAVSKQFTTMTKGDAELYRTDISGDDLYALYLESFPEGTNPIFRERTEHDCSCCKNFIRNIGNVVAVKDGKLITIWDKVKLGNHFDVVAEALSKKVGKANLVTLYRHYEPNVGTSFNYEDTGDGQVKWDHFHVKLPAKYVMQKDRIDTFLGKYNTNVDVLRRGVSEITIESVDTVLELIDQNSLYRGDEHRRTVVLARDLIKQYSSLKSKVKREVFVREKAAELGEGGRFRNTVIGTLLVDLSSGEDLEAAVGSFEAKVAPTNYKRPTALITQGMIDKAKQKVAELDLEDSLHRRFAVESDLTVNNVLFADRESKKAMGGVFDDVAPTKATKKPKLDKVETVSIEDFVNKILPKVETVEALVKNAHQPNFVSLIAPVYDGALNLFKWKNGFSWSYAGGVADSIKERVKSAGGRVDGDVRISLSWGNFDDLDLAVVEPNGERIYFGHRKAIRGSKGELDVDMNAGSGKTRSPVENITYPSRTHMKNGDYAVKVNQFSQRETDNIGFEVEIEFDGNIQTLSYDKALKTDQTIDVGYVTVSGDKLSFTPSRYVQSSTRSTEVWGVHTEQFQKVKMVLNSPNHWDGEATGNKHYFFVLDGCKNPEPARGFYNEFLHNELMEYRKVFEVLGNKMKAEPSDEQLSGLGFSSTQKNEIMLRVSGNFNRTLNVVI